MGVAYRVRQFVAALWPRVPTVSPTDLPLSGEELALFARLSPALQQHSLRVMDRVRAAGSEDLTLLRAALLHDVGKSQARIRLPHRVLYVLLDRLAPAALARLASADRSTGWRRPFYVQAGHAAEGVALLRQAGANADLIDLVARHHDPPRADDPPRLVALRRADQSE